MPMRKNIGVETEQAQHHNGYDAALRRYPPRSNVTSGRALVTISTRMSVLAKGAVGGHIIEYGLTDGKYMVLFSHTFSLRRWPMAASRSPAQKITISVPADLLAYTDAQARRLQTSRSQFISQALAQLKVSDQERLAAEGYGFYAAEARDFAEASIPAVAEALDDER